MRLQQHRPTHPRPGPTSYTPWATPSNQVQLAPDQAEIFQRHRAGRISDSPKRSGKNFWNGRWWSFSWLSSRHGNWRYFSDLFSKSRPTSASSFTFYLFIWTAKRSLLICQYSFPSRFLPEKFFTLRLFPLHDCRQTIDHAVLLRYFLDHMLLALSMFITIQN